MEEPDFWDNPEKSNDYMKELKGLKADIEDFKKLERIRRMPRNLLRWLTRRMMRV